MKFNKQNRIIVLSLLFVLHCTFSQTPNGSYAKSVYPEIKNLEITDELFIQYNEGVSLARRAIAAGKQGKDLPFAFFLYTPKKEDSIIKIAARCSIPYDAIVTLNRIESVETDITGKPLILPCLPAIYLPENPLSSIEKLNAALFEKYKAEPVELNIYA